MSQHNRNHGTRINSIIALSNEREVMNMQNGFQTVNLQGCASGVIATPAIGENGNWWIGNTDTGISASGISGPKGDQGEPGPAGPKGDDGVAADMSRVEALEKQVAELNSDNTQMGMITSGILAPRSVTTFHVTFDPEFDHIPQVIASYAQQGSTITSWLNAIKNLTQDGVDIELYNTQSTTVQIAESRCIMWMAK